MKKKAIFILAITTILLIAFLFLNKLAIKSKYEKHGFERTGYYDSVMLIKKFTVEKPLFVAGSYKGNIFFHTNNPSEIISTDTTYYNIQTSHVSIDTMDLPYLTNGFSTYQKFPFLYIYAYNLASIIRYDIINKNSITIPVPGNYTNGLNISKSSFLLKCFDSSSLNQSFYKLNVNTNKSVKLMKGKSFNGPVTSGFLLYDSVKERCAYVNQYNNGIMLLDTNMNILKNIHTIDTFSQFKINYISGKTANSQDMVYKPKGAPMLINYVSRCHNGLLYVNSKVKADNESLEKFDSNDVLDVYDIVTGSYIKSLYIGKEKGKSLIDFNFYENLLIICHSSDVKIYHII